MSTVLFVDAETSGLPYNDLPLTDPQQPHLVQLATELWDDDDRRYLAGASYIINMLDVDIPYAATAIHRIDRALSKRVGVPLEYALRGFKLLYHKADLIVCHNRRFDMFMLEVALSRLYVDVVRLDKRPWCCTMDEAAPIVNLPPTAKMLAAGRNHPKAPSLTEAIKYFFGEDFVDAHNAARDVEACRRIYFEIQDLKREQAA